jgi:transcriptional regulator with XRE-family HTH domain
MSPGTYLQKRRAAAGLTIKQVAAAFAGMPDRVRPLRVEDFALLEARLSAAEADTNPLSMPQAALLHRIYRFDLSIFELLLIHHSELIPSGLPEPQICRVCACSWHDACTFSGAPCSWMPGDPTLCTACRGRAPIGAAAASQGEPA